MSIASELDLAIKAKECDTTEGYRVEERVFPSYMSRAAWEEFLKGMSRQARADYGNGSGGELTEKGNRPPKMASFGSSSRMLYLLSRDKENFHFEKKLQTTVGGEANLDGFAEDENRYLFVEAKCREPYGPKAHTVSARYGKLYHDLSQTVEGLECRAEQTADPRLLNVTFLAEGEPIRYFDLKQMICHLLGIATAVLQGHYRHKRIDFVYLLFDPTELDLPEKARAHICEIYRATCEECLHIEFASLFTAILTFLRDSESIGDLSDEEILEMGFSDRFTFTLCDQSFYPFLLSAQ